LLIAFRYRIVDSIGEKVGGIVLGEGGFNDCAVLVPEGTEGECLEAWRAFMVIMWTYLVAMGKSPHHAKKHMRAAIKEVKLCALLQPWLADILRILENPEAKNSKKPNKTKKRSHSDSEGSSDSECSSDSEPLKKKKRRRRRSGDLSSMMPDT
jgi:hypothetical protein